MGYYEEAKAMNDELVAIRRDLHQIPEIGLALPKTVAYVAEKLTELGVDFTVYDDISTVVATIGSGAPCIMLRSDMDALPIAEESGLDFASTNGCAHACGHDCHTATLLGVAKMLKAHEGELKGTVKLLFQSAEEIMKGAMAIIDKGVMENPHVDAVFGMHVFDGYPLGDMYTGLDIMAGVYGFRIRIKGVGGHGSEPHKYVDPINTGVQVYLALQSIIAREVPSAEEAVLTIGKFDGGAVGNIIPAEVVLEGTLRYYNNEIHDKVVARMGEMVAGLCAAYRCEGEIECLSDLPALKCDPDFMQLCIDAVGKTGTADRIKSDMHWAGSEDFACYTSMVPGCMFCAGAGVADPAGWKGQHNPEVVFNEDVLAKDVAIYTQVVMDYFAK